MSKPHKWAEVIKAWADGAQVESQNEDGSWGIVPQPRFQSKGAYRVYDPCREVKEAFARGEKLEWWTGREWAPVPREPLFTAPVTYYRYLTVWERIKRVFKGFKS